MAAKRSLHTAKDSQVSVNFWTVNPLAFNKYMENVTMSECPDCSSKYHYTLSDKGSERKENVNRDWSPGS